MRDTRFAQFTIFVCSAVPLSLLGWDWYHHHLGANPTEFATRTTGVLTLLFLILSLAVTPLRKALGLPWMIKFRRLLGLYAFFYGCVHLLTYVWLRAHRRRYPQAAVYHRRHGELCDAGPACSDFNSEEHQAAWWEAVEPASQAGLRCGSRRSDSLLHACKGGYSRANLVWGGSRGFVRVPGAQQVSSSPDSADPLARATLASIDTTDTPPPAARTARRTTRLAQPVPGASRLRSPFRSEARLSDPPSSQSRNDAR